MAEDRMLSDEILLGLIKKNGGTTNYNSLSNKPQIAGTELQGNKSLSDLGIASAEDVKKEFIGTMDEWNELSTAQQKEYDTYQITDDYSEALVLNYSTTEQKTGQKWIDGKDIYFKVVNLLEVLTVPSQTWTDTGVDSSYIDTLIDAKFYDANSVNYTMNAAKLNGTTPHITVMQFRSSQIGINRMTLWYTKAA